MPGNAAKVLLTERQAQVLQEYSSSRSVFRRLSQRARLVLLAFQGCSNEAIARQTGVGRLQVGLWRRRWRDNWQALTRVECQEPRKLRQAINEVFRDAPRPGGPPRLTAAQVSQIQALACEAPRLSGRPISHWTIRELRLEVLQRNIVTNISEAQVRRYLRQAALQPHRRKLWLTTTEKDPAVFEQQATAVCQTYLEAPQKKPPKADTRSVSMR